MRRDASSARLTYNTVSTISETSLSREAPPGQVGKHPPAFGLPRQRAELGRALGGEGAGHRGGSLPSGHSAASARSMSASLDAHGQKIADQP